MQPTQTAPSILMLSKLQPDNLHVQRYGGHEQEARMNSEAKPPVTSRSRTVATKPRLTPTEKLTDDDVASLRMDVSGLQSFEALRAQIKLSREDLQSFDGEDVSAMDDARHDLLSAARNRMAHDNTALVHFLAPRVMKLRDGEAKRKWRSFVTRLQKDTKLI